MQLKMLFFIQYICQMSKLKLFFPYYVLKGVLICPITLIIFTTYASYNIMFPTQHTYNRGFKNKIIIRINVRHVSKLLHNFIVHSKYLNYPNIQNTFQRWGRNEPHKEMHSSQTTPSGKSISRLPVNFTAPPFTSVLRPFTALTLTLERILNSYKITSTTKCWSQGKQFCEKLENNDALLTKNSVKTLFRFLCYESLRSPLKFISCQK